QQAQHTQNHPPPFHLPQLSIKPMETKSNHNSLRHDASILMRALRARSDIGFELAARSNSSSSETAVPACRPTAPSAQTACSALCSFLRSIRTTQLRNDPG